MSSFRELFGLAATWNFAALVLGSVGASYLMLAHRLCWAQVQQACMREGSPAQPAEELIACLAQFRPWSQAVIDVATPIIIAGVCLVLANRVRYFGRQRFLHRLADLKISPVG